MSSMIAVTENFGCSAAELFDRIRDGTLFRLTGADRVAMQFGEGESFLLTFRDRGTIRGTFLRIVSDRELDLSWTVEGFWPDPERDTRVCITLEERHSTCTVRLRHTGIPSEASAQAKERSWREILQELRHVLDQGPKV